MMYASAFVFYGYLFFSKKRIWSVLGTSSVLLGLLFHSLSIFYRWRSIGHYPIQGAFESYLLFGWSLAAIYLVAEVFTRSKVMGSPIMLLAITVMGIAWARYESVARLDPQLKSAWISLHVVVIFLAYGGFAIAAIAALLYLIQEQQLKRRAVNLLFRRLPSLQSLDDLAIKSVVVAQVFMTMAIITGILKAIKDVPSWYIDGIVVSTVLSWLVYDFFLTSHYVWNWRGRRTAWLAIFGFILILFITFVVRPYLTVFHRYA